MDFSAENMDEILSRLNQKMAYEDVEPIHIVVCGGAALIAAHSWLLGRKVGPEFKAALAQVLDRIGYERIAEKT
jgi:hypothetical protein